MHYDTIIRGKGVFDGCTTLTEMVARSEAQTAMLKELAAAGVELRDGEVADDYAFVVTDNEGVAERFGMTPANDEDDGGWEGEGDEDDEEDDA